MPSFKPFPSNEIRELEVQVFPPMKTVFEPGVNDLRTLYPEVAEELVGVDPETIHPGSNAPLEWRCAFCGGGWTAPPKSRTKGRKASQGCPTCSRRKALEARGEKKLLTEVYPDLAAEAVSSVEGLTYGSSAMVTWQCKGHTFEKKISQRLTGKGCTYCSFRDPLPGYNDIAGVFPSVAFHLENPEDAHLLANSKDPVDWFHLTPEGIKHQWRASPNAVVYGGTGCYTCSGFQVQVGVNDFATVLKELPLHWSDENTFRPETITAGSNELVTLECREHPVPYRMTGPAKFFKAGGRACLDCVDPNTRMRSMGERTIEAVLKECFPSEVVEASVQRFRPQQVYELDILVNEKVAIDFDGTYWHQEGIFKPHGYHVKKKAAVEDLGFAYFPVKEETWLADKEGTMKALLEEVGKALGVKPLPFTGFPKISREGSVDEAFWKKYRQEEYQARREVREAAMASTLEEEVAAKEATRHLFKERARRKSPAPS